MLLSPGYEKKIISALCEILRSSTGCCGVPLPLQSNRFVSWEQSNQSSLSLCHNNPLLLPPRYRQAAHTIHSILWPLVGDTTVSAKFLFRPSFIFEKYRISPLLVQNICLLTDTVRPIRCVRNSDSPRFGSEA